MVWKCFYGIQRIDISISEEENDCLFQVNKALASFSLIEENCALSIKGETNNRHENQFGFQELGTRNLFRTTL